MMIGTTSNIDKKYEHGALELLVHEDHLEFEINKDVGYALNGGPVMNLRPKDRRMALPNFLGTSTYSL